MATDTPVWTWKSIAAYLLASEPGHTLRIAADQLIHPLDAGMWQFDAGPDNLYIDYVICLQGRTFCTARQYVDAYDMCLLRLSEQGAATMMRRPNLAAVGQSKPSPTGSLAESPGLTLALSSALGTLVGALTGGGKGAAVGALIGGGVGLAAVGVSTAASSPVAGAAAQTMFLGLAASALPGQPARRMAAFTVPAPPPIPVFDFNSNSFEPPRRRRTTSKK